MRNNVSKSGDIEEELTPELFLDLLAHLVQAMAMSVAVALRDDDEESFERFICLCTAAVSFLNETGAMPTREEFVKVLAYWVAHTAPEDMGGPVGRPIAEEIPTVELEAVATTALPHAEFITGLPYIKEVVEVERDRTEELRDWIDDALDFLEE